MNKLKKRIASIFTAAAVAVTSIGVMPELAEIFPETGGIADGFVVPASAEEINFKSWDDGGSLPSSPGSYRLNTDVTLKGTWNVPSDILNLDLNGHYITCSGTGISQFMIKQS